MHGELNITAAADAIKIIIFILWLVEWAERDEEDGERREKRVYEYEFPRCGNRFLSFCEIFHVWRIGGFGSTSSNNRKFEFHSHVRLLCVNHWILLITIVVLWIYAHFCSLVCAQVTAFSRFFSLLLFSICSFAMLILHVGVINLLSAGTTQLSTVWLMQLPHYRTTHTMVLIRSMTIANLNNVWSKPLEHKTNSH